MVVAKEEVEAEIPMVEEEAEEEDEVKMVMKEEVTEIANANSLNALGSRSYSAQEWQNLTSAERKEIYRQRNASNQGNNGGSNGNTQTKEGSQVSLNNISQVMTQRCSIGAYTTASRRTFSRLQIGAISQNTVKIGKAELDSHADTCGVHDMALVLEYTNQVAEVLGFANSMEPLQDIPIVKAALAYNHPVTGEVFVSIINQALYFGIISLMRF